MKLLLIGGTGRISAAISELALTVGTELYLLCRGESARPLPRGAKQIRCDIHDEEDAARKLEGLTFDAVADFVAYTVEDVERDYRLFAGKCAQYIFISSATVYEKPPRRPVMTEDCPLKNPYWDYARDKIACEQRLMALYREEDFPVTIVRPSHTYDDTAVPVAVHGRQGSYQVVDRMLRGKPVIVPGDGTSLWTVTHSADFARLFWGVVGNPQAVGEAYHITSGESLTWNQIYDTIGLALGVEVEKVHIPSDVLAQLGEDFSGNLLGDKAHSLVFDCGKIMALAAGLKPPKRFDQRIGQVVEYIEKHRECQTPDPEFDAWCDAVIASWTRTAEALPSFDRPITEEE